MKRPMFFSFRRIAVTTGGIAALGTQPCFMALAILLGQQLKEKSKVLQISPRERLPFFFSLRGGLRRFTALFVNVRDDVA